MINQNKQAIDSSSMACYTNKINNNLNLTSNNFTKKITKNQANLWTIYGQFMDNFITQRFGKFDKNI